MRRRLICFLMCMMILIPVVNIAPKKAGAVDSNGNLTLSEVLAFYNLPSISGVSNYKYFSDRG